MGKSQRKRNTQRQTLPGRTGDARQTGSDYWREEGDRGKGEGGEERKERRDAGCHEGGRTKAWDEERERVEGRMRGEGKRRRRKRETEMKEGRDMER